MSQAQKQKPKIPENPYIDVNYEYSLTTIDCLWFKEDIEKALKEAADEIFRRGPSMDGARQIIERKIRQKVGEIASLVKYSFDETADWDVINLNDIKVERVYDAVDVLEICFRNGVTVEFVVHADYVVAEEHIVYFKINRVELNRLWWRH